MGVGGGRRPRNTPEIFRLEKRSKWSQAEQVVTQGKLKSTQETGKAKHSQEEGINEERYHSSN